jgi:hypothetical protein
VLHGEADPYQTFHPCADVVCWTSGHKIGR